MGAKDEMHAIVAQMAASRKVVLYTSSDLEEDLSEHGLLEAINVGAVPVAGSAGR